LNIVNQCNTFKQSLDYHDIARLLIIVKTLDFASAHCFYLVGFRLTY
jgi:hypothetical protein